MGEWSFGQWENASGTLWVSVPVRALCRRKRNLYPCKQSNPDSPSHLVLSLVTTSLFNLSRFLPSSWKKPQINKNWNHKAVGSQMKGRICLPDRNRAASRTAANRRLFLLAILVRTVTERVLQMFIKLWWRRRQGDSPTGGKVHLEIGSRYEENKEIATGDCFMQRKE